MHNRRQPLAPWQTWRWDRGRWSVVVERGRWQFEDRRWFGISSAALVIHTPRGHLFVLPFEVFNRRATDGHYWGVVIGKVGRRALFALTHDGVSIGYVGRLT